MKKILLSIALAVICATSLQAIPARPGKYVFQQPDGSTITLMRHGDEWGHWLTDTHGRVVKVDSDGFYRVDEGVSPSQAAAAARIRRSARMKMHRAPQDPVAIGRKRFLVILVEFNDLPFKVEDPAAAFYRQLNEPGFSENGATGSARDYYYDNSHGKFEPAFDVFGPVKLSRNKSYYGGNDSQGNDKHPAEAVADGCKALDGQIDFSDYDLDGDGEVDLVYMYYAGYGEADSSDLNSIWPHQWSLSAAGRTLRLDGVKIDSYACSNELNGSGVNKDKLTGIGAVCHEFAHAMGLPDFYDIDGSDNGQCSGLLSFSLMDGGCYLNDSRTPPYLNMLERVMIGWLDESSVRSFTRSGPVALPGVDNNIGYMTPTDTEGEYFLYECRNADGWDKYLPGRGLLVYHVDKSGRDVSLGGYSVSASDLWSFWQYYNSINANGKHPCFYIIPAADQGNLKYGNEAYMPFPGWGRVTSYEPVGWSKEKCGYVFSDIAYADGSVTFNVTVPVVASLDFATISNPGGGVYSAGRFFTFALDDCKSDPAASVEWSFDGVPVSDLKVILTAGSHTVEASVTSQSGRKYSLTLEIEAK